MSDAVGWHPIGKAESAGESRQLVVDSFAQDYDLNNLIKPPLDPLACMRVVKLSPPGYN